jgi:hypothetical protein
MSKSDTRIACGAIGAVVGIVGAECGFGLMAVMVVAGALGLIASVVSAAVRRRGEA